MSEMLAVMEEAQGQYFRRRIRSNGRRVAGEEAAAAAARLESSADFRRDHDVRFLRMAQCNGYPACKQLAVWAMVDVISCCKVESSRWRRNPYGPDRSANSRDET